MYFIFCFDFFTLIKLTLIATFFKDEKHILSASKVIRKQQYRMNKYILRSISI